MKIQVNILKEVRGQKAAEIRILAKQFNGEELLSSKEGFADIFRCNMSIVKTGNSGTIESMYKVKYVDGVVQVQHRVKQGDIPVIEFRFID